MRKTIIILAVLTLISCKEEARFKVNCYYRKDAISTTRWQRFVDESELSEVEVECLSSTGSDHEFNYQVWE